MKMVRNGEHKCSNKMVISSVDEKMITEDEIVVPLSASKRNNSFDLKSNSKRAFSRDFTTQTHLSPVPEEVIKSSPKAFEPNEYVQTLDNLGYLFGVQSLGEKQQPPFHGGADIRYGGDDDGSDDSQHAQEANGCHTLLELDMQW
ncbi:SEC14-like 3 [Striga asiatica]|uniref:SEC14-like 3 n=1 Tax=Striga asiatica TaxID=4170 RepID=A0A5A7QBC8_STRAF|nr:SEC14-like 3 [Striga asiatica]